MNIVKESRISVLHIARWYPNKYDPMPGLFIQRHAEAASKYCDNSAVYVQAIEDDGSKSTFQVEYEDIRGVKTVCVYYHQPNTVIPFFNKLIKMFRFYKANFLGIKKIKEKQGDFDIMHIHILTRLGVIGLYYKLFKNKPFLVSEHWSRYLDATADFKGVLRKKLTQIIVKHASFVTTVTDNLARAMKSHGLNNNNYFVLDNVVDNVFYKTKVSISKNQNKTSFVNVTCFTDKAKNISGLLRVIKSLSEIRSDFEFILIGEGEDLQEMQDYANKLGLNDDSVQFRGLMEGEALAQEMANADLLVMFSNYENLPVVINECFVMGVPTVSTDVGGIKEILDNSNGVLIDARDESELIKTLNNYLDKKLVFDTDSIKAEFTERFSPKTIGFELFKLYEKALDAK